MRLFHPPLLLSRKHYHSLLCRPKWASSFSIGDFGRCMPISLQEEACQPQFLPDQRWQSCRHILIVEIRPSKLIWTRSITLTPQRRGPVPIINFLLLLVRGENLEWLLESTDNTDNDFIKCFACNDKQFKDMLILGCNLPASVRYIYIWIVFLILGKGIPIFFGGVPNKNCFLWFWKQKST